MKRVNALGLLTKVCCSLIALCPAVFTAGSTVLSIEAKQVAPARHVGFDDFVAALNLQETGGRTGRIYGDHGRSFGPLQISYRAWRDAVRFDHSIGGSYSDCAQFAYSKRIMYAFLQRHCPDALSRQDWETCARVWNGGPDWYAKRRTTNAYWSGVKSFLYSPS